MGSDHNCQSGWPARIWRFDGYHENEVENVLFFSHLQNTWENIKSNGLLGSIDVIVRECVSDGTKQPIGFITISWIL